MKKIVLCLTILCAFGFSTEYFVRVELNQARLIPLFNDGLQVIAELENCAFVLIDDAQLNAIESYSYRILDQNPQAGRYYLVRPMAEGLDLAQYGGILTADNSDYLIAINEGMLEELIREKVMLRRLSFNPLVAKNDAPESQFFSNPTVQEIVDKVDPDTVFSVVDRLQRFRTRFSTHDSCFAAADYVASKFIEYGCDSVFFQDHTSGHAPNVIGVKHGVTYPDNIYTVVCGHLDATSNFAPNIAPGADDNASGTTGVLEAARVMQGYQFDYSIRYIAFTGEEFGLYGSEYYAYYAYLANDSILGVLNGDMIGYVDVVPESLNVVAKNSNPPCGPFADFFIAAADTYTTLLTRKQMVDWAGYSDHAPFWDYGYLALLNIEDDPVENPFYHQIGDTIGSGYNDNAFCTEVIKAQVAALALLAVPHVEGIDDFSGHEAQGDQMWIRPSISRVGFNIGFESELPAELQIYDASGRLVKQFNHLTSQQFNQCTWDGRNDSGQRLPAGVYFIHFTNGSTRTTGKVILQK